MRVKNVHWNHCVEQQVETHLATVALLEEATADVFGHRGSHMRERAGLPFAALAKQEVPAGPEPDNVKL